MADPRQSGALMRFHDVTFVPRGQVLKAHEREQWLSLEQLRQEADLRIEREISQGLAEARGEIERRADDRVADCAAQLAEAFARAAGELERGVLDLALQIASRVIDSAPTEAFFSRAADHLQALVPQGSAVTIRVHPEATGALGALCDRLQSAGVRHLGVVPDASLTDRRSLLVETSDGEIDLGGGTQLRCIAAELARVKRAGQAAIGPDEKAQA